MKLLAKRLPYWLETSMENIQKKIRDKKLEGLIIYILYIFVAFVIYKFFVLERHTQSS